MRAFPLRRVIGLIVLLGLVPGCGTPSDQESSTSAVTTERLPELGDYLPPLDDGRIEVAAPKGWTPSPRSSSYIVRFQKSLQWKYPSIIVTAEDYQGGGIDRVSEKSVEKFADQVAAALKKDRSAVQAIEVGSFVGVAYRKRGKEARSVTRIVDMLFLDTVVGGRKYSIHLRSEQGSLEKDQPYLYAVVEGIKFREAESEPPPKEKPEEEKPPETKPKEVLKEKAKAKPEVQPKEKPEEDKPPKSKPKEVLKEEAKAKPKAQPKEKPKKDESLELDLDKLDKLLE